MKPVKAAKPAATVQQAKQSDEATVTEPRKARRQTLAEALSAAKAQFAQGELDFQQIAEPAAPASLPPEPRWPQLFGKVLPPAPKPKVPDQTGPCF